MNPAIPPQYRNQYQQQQHQRMQQTPHKRVPHPGVPGQPRPDERVRLHAQQQQQERAEMERAHREKHAATKPTDKTMPEGVEDLIVGDGVEQYQKLREVERKLDAMMMRKRLDLMDPIQSAVKKFTTLKIWISNTVENQPWQGRDLDENAFDFSMGVEATYRVKIEGRAIDDDDSDDEERDEEAVAKDGNDKANADTMDTDAPQETTEKPDQPPQKRTKLSHFFKQITIDFDRNKNLQPDGMTQIEWKKPLPSQAAADFDCLEFERKSDENINITISLYRDEKQERCRLSKELSELLDVDELEKSNVIMGIWEYVRAMGLQQDEEKRIINCDDRMKAVFHTEQIRFPDLPRLLDPHLNPLPPLQLQYTIRCDSDYHNNPTPTIYVLHLQAPPSPDTPLLNPNPLLPPITAPPAYATKTLAALSNNDILTSLKKQEEHTALLIQAINHSKLKHAFLTGMAKDPVGFTKRWMGSQRRDLECVLGEGGRFEGEWASEGSGRDGLRGGWIRGGKQWSGREIEEAIAVMVRKDGNARFRNVQ